MGFDSVGPTVCASQNADGDRRSLPTDQYALELCDPSPKGFQPLFLNANDASVEGVCSTPESGKRIWGVQFHPESAGGPLDTVFMFSDFVAACRSSAGGSGVALSTGGMAKGTFKKTDFEAGL